MSVVMLMILLKDYLIELVKKKQKKLLENIKFKIRFYYKKTVFKYHNKNDY